MLMELTSTRKILKCIVGILKVFLHPSPPLEKESKTIELLLSSYKTDPFLSISKIKL